ncbi:MAG: DUF1572 family protein [Leptospiraceae bacterium]
MEDLFIHATIQTITQGRGLCEKALQQISDKDFFQVPGPRSQSIAVNVKHVGGNLISRWTDFLTSDGEKEDRNRDGEFEIDAAEDRPAIMEIWARGWDTFRNSIESLNAEDLNKTVYIRSEPHSVPLAIQRSLSHTSYHIGQIVYLCRLIKEGEWTWLTIPPGGTKDFNERMRQKKA